MASHPRRKKKRRCFDAQGKEIPCPKTKKGLPPLDGDELSSAPVIETTFEIRTEICKVDDELGLVFGWAIICTEMGEPYFDLQKDHALERAMVKAVTGFMKNSRTAKEMHSGERRGEVLHSMPMTAEIAKAFGIQTDKTGWMIAMAPDEAMLAKFKSGELTGFSIGGRRLRDRILEDAS